MRLPWKEILPLARACSHGAVRRWDCPLANARQPDDRFRSPKPGPFQLREERPRLLAADDGVVRPVEPGVPVSKQAADRPLRKIGGVAAGAGAPVVRRTAACRIAGVPVLANRVRRGNRRAAAATV